MDAGTAAQANTHKARLRQHLLNGEQDIDALSQPVYAQQQQFQQNQYQQNQYGVLPQQPYSNYDIMTPLPTVNANSGSRKASLTSQSSMNRFFRRNKAGGNFNEDVGADIQELTSGANVSFDDITHIRDRGPYGMSTKTLDTTPIIPTLGGTPGGKGGAVNNIQYRKQMNQQKKIALANGARAMTLSGTNPMQQPGFQQQQGFQGQMGNDPRAMSLNMNPHYNRAMSLNTSQPMGGPRTMSLNNRQPPMNNMPGPNGPIPGPIPGPNGPRAMSMRSSQFNSGAYPPMPHGPAGGQPMMPQMPIGGPRSMSLTARPDQGPRSMSLTAGGVHNLPQGPYAPQNLQLKPQQQQVAPQYQQGYPRAMSLSNNAYLKQQQIPHQQSQQKQSQIPQQSKQQFQQHPINGQFNNQDIQANGPYGRQQISPYRHNNSSPNGHAYPNSGSNSNVNLSSVSNANSSSGSISNNISPNHSNTHLNNYDSRPLPPPPKSESNYQGHNSNDSLMNVPEEEEEAYPLTNEVVPTKSKLPRRVPPPVSVESSPQKNAQPSRNSAQSSSRSPQRSIPRSHKSLDMSESDERNDHDSIKQEPINDRNDWRSSQHSGLQEPSTAPISTSSPLHSEREEVESYDDQKYSGEEYQDDYEDYDNDFVSSSKHSNANKLHDEEAIYRFDNDKDNDTKSLSRKSTIKKSNSMRLRKLNLFSNEVDKSIKSLPAFATSLAPEVEGDEEEEDEVVQEEPRTLAPPHSGGRVENGRFELPVQFEHKQLHKSIQPVEQFEEEEVVRYHDDHEPQPEPELYSDEEKDHGIDLNDVSDKENNDMDYDDDKTPLQQHIHGTIDDVLTASPSENADGSPKFNLRRSIATAESMGYDDATDESGKPTNVDKFRTIGASAYNYSSSTNKDVFHTALDFYSPTHTSVTSPARDGNIASKDSSAYFSPTKSVNSHYSPSRSNRTSPTKSIFPSPSKSILPSPNVLLDNPEEDTTIFEEDNNVNKNANTKTNDDIDLNEEDEVIATPDRHIKERGSPEFTKSRAGTTKAETTFTPPFSGGNGRSDSPNLGGSSSRTASLKSLVANTAFNNFRSPSQEGTPKFSPEGHLDQLEAPSKPRFLESSNLSSDNTSSISSSSTADKFQSGMLPEEHQTPTRTKSGNKDNFGNIGSTRDNFGTRNTAETYVSPAHGEQYHYSHDPYSRDRYVNDEAASHQTTSKSADLNRDSTPPTPRTTNSNNYSSTYSSNNVSNASYTAPLPPLHAAVEPSLTDSSVKNNNVSKFSHPTHDTSGNNYDYSVTSEEPHFTSSPAQKDTIKDNKAKDKRSSRNFSLTNKSMNIFKRLSKTNKRTSGTFEEEAPSSVNKSRGSSASSQHFGGAVSATTQQRRKSSTTSQQQTQSTPHSPMTPVVAPQQKKPLVFTKEELSIMNCNNDLLLELELVTTELASSIKRELALENRLKGNVNSPNPEDDLLSEISRKSSQIADLEERLSKERRLRFISEEHALLSEHGQSPSPLKLNYEKTELYKQLLIKNDLVNQLEDRLQELERERKNHDQNLMDKYNDLLNENADLKFNVIPELKKRAARAPEISRSRGSRSLSLLSNEYDHYDESQEEITVLRNQREELRDVVNQLTNNHNYELRLANDKVRALEKRLRDTKLINDKLSGRLQSVTMGEDASDQSMLAHSSTTSSPSGHGQNHSFGQTSGNGHSTKSGKLSGFTIVSPTKKFFD
ncbi:uncharacterized protein RJT20DRAFT_130735 [Scheffersomyces xylosifermentans]|uniref:uncharacterized protein n=1 Tax=Scheffersomyces xylosifermentans TaxID=1304137 RepID=UPI00315D8462